MEAFILVGGHASRLHPYSEIIPKPLVPIDGKPFLTYIVDKLLEEKFERITLLVSEEDQEFFKHEFRDYPNVFFVPSGRLGTAGAFTPVKKEEPFLIIYGDLLVPSIRYDAFFKEALTILPIEGAVVLASKSTKVPWGIITPKGDFVTFQEKPVLPLIQWTGTALIHNKVLKHVFPLADWGSNIFPKILLKAILTHSEILHITSFNDIQSLSERIHQLKMLGKIKP